MVLLGSLLVILAAAELPLSVVIPLLVLSAIIGHFKTLYELVTGTRIKEKQFDNEKLEEDRRKLQERIDRFVKDEERFKKVLEDCEAERIIIESQLNSLARQNKVLFAALKVVIRNYQDSDWAQIVGAIIEENGDGKEM